MTRRYNKQILSDQLASLGEELGHTPMPNELKAGMAVKKTYLRWFGDWDTALEYAGYTADVRKQTDLRQATKNAGKKPKTVGDLSPLTTNDSKAEPNSSNVPGVVMSAVKKVDPYAPENVRFVNLYAPKVVLCGEDGTTKELPHMGTAMASFEPEKHAFAEIALKYLTCKTRVTISANPIELFLLRTDGRKDPFPGMTAGVYYLVSRKFAQAARDFGRTTLDLIYPGFISSQASSSVKITRRLEMLYHPKLWWSNP